jgi:hypothetical protein
LEELARKLRVERRCHFILLQEDPNMTTTYGKPTDDVLQTTVLTEESLIPDDRAQLTPAQMVERKLVSMTETCPMLVSHLQDSVKRRPR